jgi:hypothetical protein
VVCGTYSSTTLRSIFATFFGVGGCMLMSVNVEVRSREWQLARSCSALGGIIWWSEGTLTLYCLSGRRPEAARQEVNESLVQLIIHRLIHFAVTLCQPRLVCSSRNLTYTCLTTKSCMSDVA